LDEKKKKKKKATAADGAGTDAAAASEAEAKKKAVLARKLAANAKTGGTVGAGFQKQMDGLRNLLEATTPHFVRCVKPNMQQVLCPGGVHVGRWAKTITRARASVCVSVLIYGAGGGIASIPTLTTRWFDRCWSGPW
jgi:hypothetical protein